MPELPEVETVRRGLEPVMRGKRIVQAEIRRPDLRWPFPPRLAERLTGTTVLALRRRSKYLLCDLDSGETLLTHLGMSGRMVISGAVIGNYVHSHSAAGKHDHVILHMQDDVRVTFNDPRRFGMMDLLPTEAVEAHKLLASLGPEPLGNMFNAPALARSLAKRRAPIKTALLDQRVVAGLGNIYVCEALFRSGISPTRQAGRISSERLAALVDNIRTVLVEAIAAGGSSLRDHRQASGELGYFQHSFSVYDRESHPCPRDECGGVVRRIVQSGRSSFYCPACQR